MNFGQTNLVKSLGSAGHLLGLPVQGFVLRDLPVQWTPRVTCTLMNFPFRSLEKFQIVLHVHEIK
jgi:hypothetical protein